MHAADYGMYIFPSSELLDTSYSVNDATVGAAGNQCQSQPRPDYQGKVIRHMVRYHFIALVHIEPVIYRFVICSHFYLTGGHYVIAYSDRLFAEIKRSAEGFG